jgi:hypothetical protein
LPGLEGLLPGDAFGPFREDLMDTVGPDSILSLGGEAAVPAMLLAGRCGEIGCGLATKIGPTAELTFPPMANPARAKIAAPAVTSIEPEMWRWPGESGCELGLCTKTLLGAAENLSFAKGEQAALVEVDFCCLVPSAAESHSDNPEGRWGLQV